MDRDEFTARLSAMERVLYLTARTLLKSPADCADAMQEATLSAWATLHRLRDEARLEGYVLQILRHRCYQMLRAQREIPVDQLPEAAEAVPDSALSIPVKSIPGDRGPDAAQPGSLGEEEARYAAALATDFLAALGIGTEDVALHTHRNAPAYEGSFWISDEMRAANEQRYAERAKKHLENHGYPIDGYTLVAAPFVLRGLRLATVISWDAGYADDPGAHIATDIGASFDILDGGDILGFAMHNVPLVTSETPYALVSWQEALQIAPDRKQEVYYGLQPDQIDVSQKDPYGGTLEPYLNVVTRIALEYVSDVQWTFRPVWRFYQEARPVE